MHTCTHTHMHTHAHTHTHTHTHHTHTHTHTHTNAHTHTQHLHIPLCLAQLQRTYLLFQNLLVSSQVIPFFFHSLQLLLQCLCLVLHSADTAQVQSRHMHITQNRAHMHITQNMAYMHITQNMAHSQAEAAEAKTPELKAFGQFELKLSSQTILDHRRIEDSPFRH